MTVEAGWQPDPIPEPPQEYLDYVVGIAESERDGTADRATLCVGPFTAFCMIAALQVAVRHPVVSGSMKTTLRSIVDQLKPWFDGTPVEEALRRGDHPEWDVRDDDTPVIMCPRGCGFSVGNCGCGGEDSSG